MPSGELGFAFKSSRRHDAILSLARPLRRVYLADLAPFGCTPHHEAHHARSVVVPVVALRCAPERELLLRAWRPKTAPLAPRHRRGWRLLFTHGGSSGRVRWEEEEDDDDDGARRPRRGRRARGVRPPAVPWHDGQPGQ
jgi:hypothetical protein